MVNDIRHFKVNSCLDAPGRAISACPVTHDSTFETPFLQEEADKNSRLVMGKAQTSLRISTRRRLVSDTCIPLTRLYLTSISKNSRPADQNVNELTQSLGPEDSML